MLSAKNLRNCRFAEPNERRYPLACQAVEFGTNDASERLPPLARCAHHSKPHNLFSDILAEIRRKLIKKNVIEERISEIAGFKLYE